MTKIAVSQDFKKKVSLIDDMAEINGGGKLLKFVDSEQERLRLLKRSAKIFGSVRIITRIIGLFLGFLFALVQLNSRDACYASHGSFVPIPHSILKN